MGNMIGDCLQFNNVAQTVAEYTAKIDELLK